MSGLVLNESAIDPADIKKATITIDRISHANAGVRIWYVIRTTQDEVFQRWSMLMNETDELLLIAKSGDIINIEYIDDHVEDPVSQQFESFNRSVILKAYK